MRYRISTRAVTDIKRAYWQGAEQFGIRQAVSYQAKLKATFELIADNPSMARERREIQPPVRVHRCGSHMIIYEIDERGVHILRVRHHLEEEYLLTVERSRRFHETRKGVPLEKVEKWMDERREDPNAPCPPAEYIPSR